MPESEHRRKNNQKRKYRPAAFELDAIAGLNRAHKTEIQDEIYVDRSEIEEVIDAIPPAIGAKLLPKKLRK